MPIIEPRQKPNSEASSRSNEGQSPKHANPSPAVATGQDRRGSAKWFWILGGLVTLILLSGYYYWNHFKSSSNGSERGDSVVGSTSTSSEIEMKSGLAIHRFAKLASIASLSRKEFDVNFVSLDEATRAGNPQIIAALEIVIQKKRQELTESKKNMIESLMELNMLRQAQPSTVDGLIQTTISEAKSREENETARLLEPLTAMLENAPASPSAKKYFSDAIENRL
jgi:hypothetical protein